MATEEKKTKDKDDAKSPRGKKDKKEHREHKDKEEKESDVPDFTGPPTKHALDAKKCPVTRVTVFNDRAEVTRHLEVDLEKGNNEVAISPIVDSVDWDSVRVAGGRGAAVILEVAHDRSYTAAKPVDESEKGRLQKKLEEIGETMQVLARDRTRLDKEREWLEGYAANVRTPIMAPKSKEKALDFEFAPFSADNIQGLERFMKFYAERQTDLDGRELALSKKIKDLEEEKKKVQLEISTKFSGAVGRRDPVNQILITLFARDKCHLELEVVYLLRGPSWRASYDCRVTSGAKEIELTYYGNIINNSGEDWENVEFSLSTATPSTAGKPPDLFTKYIRFRPKVEPPRPYSSSSASANPLYSAPQPDSRARRPQAQAMVAAPMRNMAVSAAELSGGDGDDYIVPEPTQVLTATSTQGALSATFAIPRKATILSDSKPHKVTIKLLKLEANFSYTMLPRLSLQAYLKASVKNTTKNVTLIGGEMSVFVDNNFIAKSDIPTIPPNDSIGVFLGTDPGVKVEYRPVKKMSADSGVFSKWTKVNCEHKIIVTNNKEDDIVAIVFDQLPKSSDSSLKVKLVEPVVPEDVNNEDVEAPLMITPANNVRWKMTLKKGERVEIPFIYTIEHPADKETMESSLPN